MGHNELFADERFGEELPGEPDQCPPEDASKSSLKEVFRLVPVGTPSDREFMSHAALGKVRPPTINSTDCEWASCSLRTDVNMLLKMSGLRRRNPFVATLSIPSDSGRHTTDGTHVNFWRHQDFSISSAVVDVYPHLRS